MLVLKITENGITHEKLDLRMDFEEVKWNLEISF